MRNNVMMVAASAALLIYAALSFYIGLRGWQGLVRYLPGRMLWIYCAVVALLSVSYLVGRLLGRFMPGPLFDALSRVGAFWMAAMLYLLMAAVLADIVRLADRFAHFLPPSFKNGPLPGAILMLAVAAVLLYGVWNSQHAVVRHIAVEIPVEPGHGGTVRIAAVSDIHLGNIVGKKRLAYMIDRINALHPDLVLMAGDIVDEEVGPFISQGMDREFARLKAPYGVYAVTGNHEFYSGHGEEIVRRLEASGVQELRDRCVEIAGRFYVAGREDPTGQSFSGRKRRSIGEILAGTDPALPVILMDHQPSKSSIRDSEEAGIELQLSGHTHHGQLFPLNLVTGLLFEDDWGYMKKGNYQLIVSCGFGTWGPSLRTGSVSEILDIEVRLVHIIPGPLRSGCGGCRTG